MPAARYILIIVSLLSSTQRKHSSMPLDHVHKNVIKQFTLPCLIVMLVHLRVLYFLTILVIKYDQLKLLCIIVCISFTV